MPRLILACRCQLEIFNRYRIGFRLNGALTKALIGGLVPDDRL